MSQQGSSKLRCARRSAGKFRFVVHGGKILAISSSCRAKARTTQAPTQFFAGQQGHFVQRILGGAVPCWGTVTRMISQTTSEIASVTSTSQNPMVGLMTNARISAPMTINGQRSGKAQRHVSAVLQLVHIAGDAGDQRGRADAVQLRSREVSMWRNSAPRSASSLISLARPWWQNTAPSGWMPYPQRQTAPSSRTACQPKPNPRFLMPTSMMLATTKGTNSLKTGF